MTHEEIQEGFKILRLDTTLPKQPVQDNRSLQQPYYTKEPYQKISLYKFCQTTRTSNIKNS